MPTEERKSSDLTPDNVAIAYVQEMNMANLMQGESPNPLLS